MSEIADNKWEVEAAKPPIMNFSGIVQILMMVAFSCLFLFILAGSVYGLVSPKQEGGWEDKLKNKPAAAAKAKPAAAPEG